MLTTHFPRERGTSLIEMLVAVLLLAIGLLSMVGLQANALKLSKEAQFRSTAADLANTFAEAAKANVTAALTNGYDYTVAYAAPAGPIPVPNTCRDGVTTCTAAQIAADDVASWRESARLNLPGGSLFAQLVPGGANTPASIDLWVLWQGPQSDDLADAATAQLNNNCPAAIPNANRALQCLPFKISL